MCDENIIQTGWMDAYIGTFVSTNLFPWPTTHKSDQVEKSKVFNFHHKYELLSSAHLLALEGPGAVG